MTFEGGSRGFVPINLPRCWIYLCNRTSRVMDYAARLFPIALSFFLPSFLSFFLRIGEDREGELDTELTRDSIGLDPFQFKLYEEM